MLLERISQNPRSVIIYNEDEAKTKTKREFFSSMSRLFSGCAGFPKTDSFSYRRFVELVKTSVDDDGGAWSREVSWNRKL